MRRLSTTLLIPLLALLTGCPEDPCARAQQLDPVLDIGTGENDFVPLEDGDTATLSYGNQGGQHIWTALHAAGLNPGERGFFTQDADPVRITLVLEGETDGALVGSYYSDWLAMAGGPEDAEITGLQLVVSLGYASYDDTEEEPLVQDYRLSAEVEDVCGTLVTAERVVKLPE